MSFQFELDDRNCYNCAHYGLCFLRHRVGEAMHGVGMGLLNINNPETTPRGFQCVFEALAMACMRFERTPLEEEPE